MLESRYSKLYEKFIKKCRARKDIKGDFFEIHHIVPRSLGGNNDKDNLIKLTPREHFFAHLLLSKMHSGENQIKMAHALRMMAGITKSKNHITSRSYDLAKNIIYKVLQSAGKDYQQEKELQDSILTEFTDITKVFERGTCKICGIRPKSINYIKNDKTFYRSKCEVCLAGNNKFKLPQWKFDGYLKLQYCESCEFESVYQEQLTVITDNKKYKTICMNCQVAEKFKLKQKILKPLSDY
jgi:hypothetical protein